MRKNVRRWLSLVVVAVVLVLAAYHLSTGEEWKRFSWDQVWLSLKAANPFYLVAALATTYATYVVRAYRWRFFLDPIKKSDVWPLFVGQVLGFAAIYLLGRPGELVRPAYIAKKENVTFTSQAAIWLLERIYDMIFIVLLFSLALTIGPLQPGPAHARHLVRTTRGVGLVILLVSLLIVAVLVIFRLRAEELRAGGTPRFLRFLSERGRQRADHFLKSFVDGLEVIENWQDFLYSVTSSALLWVLNATVFWFTFHALGGDLARLSWLAAALVLVSSILGMLAQLPGIGGGFQVAAIGALNGFFHVRPEVATGAGILLWLMISVPCVSLGLVLLVYEGLTFKKLEAVSVEQHRPAPAEKV